MAFVSVSLPSVKAYTSFKVGDVMVTGWYVGSYEGQYGLLHKFRTESGEVVAIPKSGGLDLTIKESVKVGDYCQLTYEGKGKAKPGAKFKLDFNMVNVQVDPERSLRDGSAIPSTPSLPVNVEPEVAAPKAPVATEVVASEDDDVAF